MTRTLDDKLDDKLGDKLGDNPRQSTGAATDQAGSLSLPALVQSYFDALNAKDFERTAALFSEQGRLIPPFEKPIEGREAIAHYLATEASEMTLTPLTCEPQNESENLKNEATQSFRVEGKVKHSLFIVNVVWQFDLATTDKIESVQIKLLASFKELLKVKR